MEGTIELLISCSLFHVAVLRFDVQKLTGSGRQSIQMEMWESMFLRVGIFFFLELFLVPDRNIFSITKRNLVKMNGIMNSTLLALWAGVELLEWERLGTHEIWGRSNWQVQLPLQTLSCGGWREGEEDLRHRRKGGGKEKWTWLARKRKIFWSSVLPHKGKKGRRN